MPPEADLSKFKPRSDLVRLLLERGHIYQATDIEGLDAAALKGPLSAYIGFDATGQSLHVGSLMQIMTLRRLQQTGHRPIVLMGGGTTKVGDPSDKATQRPLLSDAEIAINIAGIRRAFEPFLRFGKGPTDAVMVNNAEWLEKLGYIDFLREYGVHFTINKMVALEFVRSRLEAEQPLTFLEFNYMLMQATDFRELNRRFDCTLQFGGSEQWGNIVNGIDLIRRMDGREAFGLTTPLVTTASGVKMGKTVEGAVWLNAEMRSAYDYWQFWRNTEDADVGRFLKLFTELPMDEIDELLKGDINDAKKRLANEATTLLHGINQAIASELTARLSYEDGKISEGLPTRTIERAGWDVGRSNNEIAFASGLFNSKSDARRKIVAGEIRINDETVTDPAAITRWDQVDSELGVFKVQLGKRGKTVLIKPI